MAATRACLDDNKHAGPTSQCFVILKALAGLCEPLLNSLATSRSIINYLEAEGRHSFVQCVCLCERAYLGCPSGEGRRGQFELTEGN